VNSRLLRILHLVAESYIRTAQPVASARIADRLGLSSATVRNEFATLEAEGYLHQPHASAGRIPTALGFRRYAERFLPPRPLPATARRYLEARLGAVHGETLLRRLAHATAELSGYAVVVTLAADDHLHAHEIHLSLLSDRTVMAVVVLENGLVRQLRVALEPAPSDTVLDDAERNLRQLTLPLREVPGALERQARRAERELARTLRAIAAAWPEVTPDRSATAGLRGLLKEPESRDPDFVRLVIEHIELPLGAGGGSGAEGASGAGAEGASGADADDVTIDTDDALARVRAAIHIGEAVGLLTLVGPARMRYGPALRVVHGVSAALRGHETA
jgi:heat-inducible transcriptional repressor